MNDVINLSLTLSQTVKDSTPYLSVNVPVSRRSIKVVLMVVAEKQWLAGYVLSIAVDWKYLL